MAQIETVGGALRQARERSGIALDEVAKAIKVGVHLLEALESDQFDRLPGGPFNKGFVRAYARHVGLDPESTVLDYAREERARGMSTPDADRTRRWDFSHFATFHIEEDRKTLVLDWVALRTVLVGALAVVILTLGGWTLFRVGWSDQPVSAAGAESGTTLPSGSPAADPVQVPDAGSATQAEPMQSSRTPSGPVAVNDDVAADENLAGRSSRANAIAAPDSTPAVLTDPSPPSGESLLLISESGVGTAVVNRALVNSGDRFAAGRRLFFWTRSVDGRRGDVLRHVWLHEGRSVASFDLQVGGPHWRNFSRYTPGANRTGTWAVEAQDATGRVLARQTFVCIARK